MNFSTGNSFDPRVILNCKHCGPGKVCKVCHRHGRERGRCEECPSEKPPRVASSK